VLKSAKPPQEHLPGVLEYILLRGDRALPRHGARFRTVGARRPATGPGRVRTCCSAETLPRVQGRRQGFAAGWHPDRGLVSIRTLLPKMDI
jgi:hypothetical protein